MKDNIPMGETGKLIGFDMDFLKAAAVGRVSVSEALEIFDGLEPVETRFMVGIWKGSGFPTGHPMDGLLEAYQWYGKCFFDSENVHPLVFTGFGGRRLSINPIFMLPLTGLMGRGTLPKSKKVARLLSLCIPFFATSRSQARLRMTDYRGKSSATMIYDNLPINDVFRKVDEDTVLGVMDLKNTKQPFFFVLRRGPADR